LKTFGVSLTAKVTVGAVDFTSISAYERANYYNLNDSDASPIDFIQVTYADKQHQFSQEFRAASNGEGPLNWIAGLYYYTEKLTADNLYDIGEFIRDLGVPPDLADPNAPLKIAQPYTQKTDSYAGFGQATYALTPDWKVTLGARYTHDKKSIDFRTYADEPLLGFPPLIDAFSKSQSFDALTGRVGMDYQVTPDAMIYASYNRGYKSGGFNGGALFDPQEATPFSPEHANAFEAGFKTSWLDGHLTLNGAVFYNTYSNLQVFQFIAGPTGLPITLISNAAGAHIKGAELEATALLLPGLRLEMGLGILDTKFTKFLTLAPVAGGAYVPVDLSGTQLVGAPKANFNGSLEYAINMPSDWVVKPRVQWSYTSHQFYSTSNDPLLAQKEYWLVDASLGIDSPGGGWGLSIWGKNIFGQHYNMDIVPMSSFGFNQVVRGERRTYGLTLHFKY
jgi:iron complex outermembrane receptor protein